MSNILGKVGSTITLQSADGAAMTNLSGLKTTTANLDMRAGGNAVGHRRARIELQVAWATITGIVAGKSIAEVYLVPVSDGTNSPQVNTTAGASAFPLSCFFGLLMASAAPTSNVTAYFVTGLGKLPQQLCHVYIKNVSGQQMNVNWEAKAYTEYDEVV